MQGPILVFLMLVVISAVIGAVSQVLKNAAQQPPPQARPRPRPAAAAKPASGDIDKFLEEIDRLRRKRAEAEAVDVSSRREDPPVAKPVARPVKSSQAQVARAVPPPETRRRRKQEPPTPPPAETKPAQKWIRVSERPTLPSTPEPLAHPPETHHRPVVTAPLQLPALPKVTSGPVVTASPGQQRQTPFARQLKALLTSPQAVPMAVVLGEILGPPKCKRG